MMMHLAVMANNLTISGVSVNGNQATFNLAWDNSWNASGNIDTLYPANWDAVWIFVKVQSDTDNLWHHQLLAPAGHSVNTSGAGLTIETQPDNVGVFIRRSQAGHGNISGASVTLSLAGLPAGSNFNFKVFGVEMVHIPEGAFYLGDGQVSSTSEVRFRDSTVSASRQAAGFPAGSLYSGSPAIPAAFPMGYNAFYAMKYEITNEQIADFLNTLTYDQQASHMVVAPNAASGTALTATVTGYSNHNYLKIMTPGLNNTTPAVIGCDYNSDAVFNDLPDGLTVACGTMKRRTLLAYLDWCGMRPATEMEFEKMCRGSRVNGNPVARVTNEYAWGSTDFAAYAVGSIGMTDLDMPTMRLVTTVVNGRDAMVGSDRPMRVGLFAEGATGRAAAGAGFYGNMNLSGNVAELVISVAADGAGYTAMPGDGDLSVTADANQSSWPVYSAPNAYGFRGGYFAATASSYGGTPNTPGYYNRMPKTSQRAYCPYNVDAPWQGARGVR